MSRDRQTAQSALLYELKTNFARTLSNFAKISFLTPSQRAVVEGLLPLLQSGSITTLARYRRLHHGFDEVFYDETIQSRFAELTKKRGGLRDRESIWTKFEKGNAEIIGLSAQRARLTETEQRDLGILEKTEKDLMSDQEDLLQYAEMRAKRYFDACNSMYKELSAMDQQFSSPDCDFQQLRNDLKEQLDRLAPIYNMIQGSHPYVNALLSTIELPYEKSCERFSKEFNKIPESSKLYTLKIELLTKDKEGIFPKLLDRLEKLKLHQPPPSPKLIREILRIETQISQLQRNKGKIREEYTTLEALNNMAEDFRTQVDVLANSMSRKSLLGKLFSWGRKKPAQRPPEKHEEAEAPADNIHKSRGSH